MLFVLTVVNLSTFKLKTQENQEVKIEGNHIEISQELFDQIKNWQNKRDGQLPLDKFLATKNISREMQPKVVKLMKQLRGGSRETDCNCAMLTVNSSYHVAPDFRINFHHQKIKED